MSTNERPILFNGPMVCAILEGRKTQTRRIMKPVPLYPDSYFKKRVEIVGDEALFYRPGAELPAYRFRCPYGQPGDRLWVRETWRIFDAIDECGHADFPCNCPPHKSPLYRATHDDGESKWRPSIHMPRWASRITLEVTGVRVERLQDISIEDAISEGVNCACESDRPCESCGTCEGDEWDNPIHLQCNPRSAFASLWNSINAKTPGCSWDDNPWVWAVEFRRVQP